MTLTVPPSAAGVQGPCPKCWQEIISPDPARGLEASLPRPQSTPPPDEVPTPTAPEAPAPPPAPIEPLPPVARAPRISWVVPTFASALICLGAGYLIGKNQRPTAEAAPVRPVLSKGPTPTAPTPAPTPEPQSEPAPAPPEPTPSLTTTESPTDTLTPEAALKGFLEAKDWQTRKEFVIYPDDMAASIEKRAKELGDGPFQVTAIRLQQVYGPVHLYWVSTVAIPDGFPVGVRETKEGGPKVEWLSFLGFHDDLFRKFADGPAGATGTFHVLVKAAPLGNEAASAYARFQLSTPMPGREQDAWLKKDSVVLARMRGILEGSDKFPKELLEKEGAPLILKLVKRQPNEKQQFIEILELEGIGWLPE